MIWHRIYQERIPENGSTYNANTSNRTVVDVMELKLELPCQPWPNDPKLRKVGHYMATNFAQGIRGLGWMFLEKAGLTAEEIEAVCYQAKRDLLDSDLHLHTTLQVMLPKT